MTAPKVHTLTLPVERYGQLSTLLAKAHPEARLRTFSDLIGQMVRVFAAVHQIDVGIPGVTVTRCSDGVMLQIDELPPLPLSREEARALAATLRQFVEGKQRGAVEGPEGNYRISKKGNGLRLEVRDGDAYRLKSYAPDIAFELAEHLDDAATPATE